ncbi:MAG TPA: FliH/SctL family protein [Xanthobacteraceae bacterium]
MSAPAKFLFDNDFGRSGKAAAGAVPLAEHQLAVAGAESRGYLAGHAAARAESAVELDRQVAVALGRAADALQELARGLAGTEARREVEAVEIAAAVAAKLAPALIAREPFAEVAALATECLRHLVGTPHVVVRVSEDVYELAQPKLQEIAAASGFEGRLIVLGEPGIGQGDCRIEWADGGTVRNRAAVEALIGQAVDRYLAVRAGGAAPDAHTGADLDG